MSGLKKKSLKGLLAYVLLTKTPEAALAYIEDAVDELCRTGGFSMKLRIQITQRLRRRWFPTRKERREAHGKPNKPTVC